MFLSLVSVVAAANPLQTRPAREVIIHGFRAPSTGIEIREGGLGFHLGVYPTVLGSEEVTTWFTKVGVTLYGPSFALGRKDRDSGLYFGASLLQGLTGPRSVTVDLASGTGFSGEGGFRWAAVRGLELRLGVAVLGTAAGEVFVNPTPGLSYAVPLGPRESRTTGRSTGTPRSGRGTSG